MAITEMYLNERLDHLGIVAGVCQEIGLAAWLDAQDPDNRQNVSVGTATVAMVLNGLGFSNRRLYLVPQFFANKPVEHLLGGGITAEMLNDDCLGRSLDWLYEHDLTKLFAGIASRARQIFGIKAEQVHVDTTSFSVSGAYANATPRATESAEAKEAPALQEALIAITYGYSRDHRDDLKQWMLALATTHDGDVPLFLQPLDGNSSDKVSLLAVIQTIQTQLREVDAEASVYVADNGVYSASNMKQLNLAGVKWVSRVSETLTEARRVLQEGSDAWQHSEDGTMHWFCREIELPQGTERWVIVRTHTSEQRAHLSMQQQVSRAQSSWQQKCWHLSNRRFACEADARVAFERDLKGKPSWLEVHSQFVAHPQYAGKGRPRKDASPVTSQWQIVATVTVNQQQVDQEAARKACWIVGTNVLDPALLSDQSLVTTYKEQGGVERGFRFLRISSLSGLLRLCQETGADHGAEFHHGVVPADLSLSRISAALPLGRDAADHSRSSAQAHSTPDDAALVFQCFEGIELLHVQTATTSLVHVLRLQALHELILHLLGPPYEKIYKLSG